MAETKQLGSDKSIRHWLILVVCCAASLCGVGLASNTYGVFLPFIVQDTGWATSQVSIFMTVSAWSTMAFYFVGAKVLSRFNTKVVTVIGGLGVCIGLFLLSTVTQVWHLYICTFLIGTSLAFCALNIIPLLINNWFIKHRNLVMGISYVFTSVAGAIFNPLFASLSVAHGWRYTYRIAACIGLIYVVLALLFVAGKPSDVGLRPYGISESEEMKDVKDQVEIKEFPGIPAKYAFRTATFWLILLFVVNNSFCTGFNQHWVNLGVTSGFDPVKAATLTTIGMISSSIFKIVEGRMSDSKFGIMKTAIVCSVVPLIAMIILIVAGTASYSVVAIACFLFGVGIAMTQLMPPQLVRDMYGMRSYSTLYPIAFMAMSLGTGFTYTLHGVFIQAAGSYMGSFIFNSCCYVVGIIVLTIGFKLSKNAKAKYWREVGEAL